MGYMVHHAFLVTSWCKDEIEKVYDFCAKLFPVEMISELKKGLINGYYSFTIFPDGSKEGWPESAKQDKKRQQFIEHLDSYKDPDDGSTAIDWALIQYGDDEGDNKIIQHDSSPVKSYSKQDN